MLYYCCPVPVDIILDEAKESKADAEQGMQVSLLHRTWVYDDCRFGIIMADVVRPILGNKI